MRIRAASRSADGPEVVRASCSDSFVTASRTTLSEPNSAPWYWTYDVPQRWDLARLRPPEYDHRGKKQGFETDADCLRYNAKHVAALRKGGQLDRELADSIDSCGQRWWCGSAACKFCMRQWRRAVAAQALPIAEQLEGQGLTAVLLTLVFTDPALRSSKLPTASFKSIKQRLRMTIRRAGLGHVPMSGGIEIDWNERSDTWDLHVHLMAFVDSKDDLDPMRLHFKKARGVSRPMQVDIVNDPVKAVPYCWKFAPMRKLRYEQDGKTYSRKLGLHDHHLRSALRWLDRHHPDDFVYAQGGLKLLRGRLSMS